jgi:hypothetical protein
MQMAQSMPQGAMRVVLKGLFAAIHGIMFCACKKMPRQYFHHPHSPCLNAGHSYGHDDKEMDVNPVRTQRIETGTPEGDALGFTGDLFSGWLEMGKDNRIYLHYIISRHRCEGNVQALLLSWLEQGYDLRVVMPRPIMQHILQKFGFTPALEYFPDQYEDKVEVWYRPSGADAAGKNPANHAAAGMS